VVSGIPAASIVMHNPAHNRSSPFACLAHDFSLGRIGTVKSKPHDGEPKGRVLVVVPPIRSPTEASTSPIAATTWRVAATT
jgi:hypothetical protein